jgi:SAM-dependent methyltransferase
MIWQALVGAILAPLHMMVAWILGAPGIKIHLKCAFLTLRLILLWRISLRKAYLLIFFPLDSTRYFELHDVLKNAFHVPFSRCLDVSSPRLLPLLLLMRNKAAVANMINPDIQDMEETKRLADALGIADRCTFKSCTIEEAKYAAESFDLITCISVLEHIPADKNAVAVMWSLLRPGGRLILTLPCKAQPLEQYISDNAYGVLSPGSDGYTFWQRFYDEERLQSVIYNITGVPTNMVVYGEKKYGLFYKNASMKRLLGLPLYPFWREAYMMAMEYRYFEKISELPGEGVIMVEFIKS